MKKIAALFLVALAGGAVAIGLFFLIEKKGPVYADIPVTVPVQQVNLSTSAPMNIPDF